MTGKTPKTNKRSQLIVFVPGDSSGGTENLEGPVRRSGGTVMIKARVADDEGR